MDTTKKHALNEDNNGTNNLCQKSPRLSETNALIICSSFFDKIVRLEKQSGTSIDNKD